MPDNYTPFSNGKVKDSSHTLNGIYPKYAFNPSDESLNHYILDAAGLVGYANNPNFYILEPDISGWGTDYQLLYASDYAQSVVIKYVGGSAPPPPPASTGTNYWSTYSASKADGSYYYPNTVDAAFTVVNYNYVFGLSAT